MYLYILIQLFMYPVIRIDVFTLLSNRCVHEFDGCCFPLLLNGHVRLTAIAWTPVAATGRFLLKMYTALPHVGL